jgi:hypothetical protein
MTKQQEKDINWLEQQIKLCEREIDRCRWLGMSQSVIDKEHGNIRRYKRFIDYIKNCDKSNKDSD